MSPTKCVILIAAILHISFSLAGASPGDRDPLYRGCVHTCGTATGCATLSSVGGPAVHGLCPLPLCRRTGPFILRALRWDCLGDCRYHCMHALEISRKSQGLLARKYHGKWPFVRVIGMQEAFSVMMSLGNLAQHLIGTARFLRGSQMQGPRHYTAAWTAYIGVSVWTWVASAVFHARDTPLTEKLDYMAAFATVVTGFAVSVIRCFGMSRRLWQLAIGAAFSMIWGGHMYYMLLIKFDYGWNMQLCVGLGLTQAMLWIAWSQISRHPGRTLLLTFVLAVNGAMLFELLDFEPIFGLFDAHGIWHALTIIITPLWYQFMINDTTHLAQTSASKAQ